MCLALWVMHSSLAQNVCAMHEVALQMRRTSAMNAHINRIMGQQRTASHRLLFQELAVADLRDYLDATLHGL